MPSCEVRGSRSLNKRLVSLVRHAVAETDQPCIGSIGSIPISLIETEAWKL